MSVPTFQSRARREVMERVQNAINKTGLGTAKVWNPWPTVMEKGVTTEDILQPSKGYGGKVQEPIPFGVPLKNFRTAEKTRLASALGSEELTEANYLKALKKITEDYVEAGKANYRDFKDANCTLFACCTIGMLAQNPKLLPEGTRVELFNLTESTEGQGHAYVVIGRANCDNLQNIKEYGPNCFFIDPWYARHRLTEPGPLSVKAATDDDKKFWDDNFINDFLSGGKFKVMLSFVITKNGLSIDEKRMLPEGGIDK